MGRTLLYALQETAGEKEEEAEEGCGQRRSEFGREEGLDPPTVCGGSEDVHD